MINRQEFARLCRGVLLLSLLAWAFLLAGGDGSCHCAALSWKALLESPAAPARGWALMLVAMMAPMLAPPFYFIRLSSFARSRVRLGALFVIGYGGLWMAAGPVFMAAELGARQWLPGPFWPAVIVGLAALVWQASPGKQVCLNRCHRHRPLAAFGWAANRDALRMGLEHATWCIGSCWAIMLFPMLLPAGQNAAMAAVTVLMFCERLDPGAAPRWRLRGFRTAYLYLSRRLRGARIHPWPFAQAQPS